jgi:integrase
MATEIVRCNEQAGVMTRRKQHEIPIKEQLGKLQRSEKLALQVMTDRALAGVDDPPDIVSSVARPHERFRTQKGELITYADGIYLRYYITAKDGRRLKTSEWLCELGASFREQEKAKVKRMRAVNIEQRSKFTPIADDMTVAIFWDALYYPLVKENKSWSTALTYKRIWDMYLKEHFETRSLAKYRTSEAYRFLESLATRKLKRGNEIGLNKSSLGLCRGICYGLFRSAKNKDLIDTNPYEDVVVDVKVRKKGKTIAYTLAEVAKVNSEIPRLHARLIFSFCALLGMRPSEAAAIKWDDIENGVVHIRRSAPRGHEQNETKTDNSVRVLDLIKPVADLVEQYRKQVSKAEGYLFKRLDGSVINVSEFADYNISRFGKAAIGDRWRGLYAGRRGVGTAQFNLTGDTRASFQTLGHSKETSVAHYIQPSNEQGRAGQRMLEAAYQQEVDKLSQK